MSVDNNVQKHSHIIFHINADDSESCRFVRVETSQLPLYWQEATFDTVADDIESLISYGPNSVMREQDSLEEWIASCKRTKRLDKEMGYGTRKYAKPDMVPEWYEFWRKLSSTAWSDEKIGFKKLDNARWVMMNAVVMKLDIYS